MSSEERQATDDNADLIAAGLALLEAVAKCERAKAAGMRPEELPPEETAPSPAEQLKTAWARCDPRALEAITEHAKRERGQPC